MPDLGARTSSQHSGRSLKGFKQAGVVQMYVEAKRRKKRKGRREAKREGGREERKDSEEAFGENLVSPELGAVELDRRGWI